MHGATVIAPREGELIGDSPERRVEILWEEDALHATWSRLAAGRDGADRHIHRGHTDIFYVLDGELTSLLEDQPVPVPAGSFAVIPPLVAHGFRNAGTHEVRYLNVHVAGSRFADYLRALRDGGSQAFFDQEDPAAAGTRPATDAVFGGTTPPGRRRGVARGARRGRDRAPDRRRARVNRARLALCPGVPRAESRPRRALTARATHRGGRGAGYHL